MKLLNDGGCKFGTKDDGCMTSEVQQRKAAATVVMAEAMLKKESH